MSKNGDDKPKYEAPAVMALGELASAVGQSCTGGTMPGGACNPGGVGDAACVEGSGPKTDCNPGTAAPGTCDTGTGAG